MSISISSAETIPGLTGEDETDIGADGDDILLSPTQELSLINTEQDSFYSIIFYIKRLLPASASREEMLSSSSSVASYLNLALVVGRAFIQQKIGLGGNDDTSCVRLTREEEYIPDVTPMSIKRTLSSIKLLARHFLAKNGNVVLDASIRRLLHEDGLEAEVGERYDPSAEDVQRFFSLCFEDPAIVRSIYSF
jgi:hypothetical protein